jgi:hypothetical protein
MRLLQFLCFNCVARKRIERERERETECECVCEYVIVSVCVCNSELLSVEIAL